MKKIALLAAMVAFLTLGFSGCNSTSVEENVAETNSTVEVPVEAVTETTEVVVGEVEEVPAETVETK